MTIGIDPAIGLARELAAVREQRQAIEAKLPAGTYLVADLPAAQRRAWDALCELLTREQDLIGAEWSARGGRLLTRADDPTIRFVTFIEPPSLAARTASRAAVGDAFDRILRRRHPGTAWEVGA